MKAISAVFVLFIAAVFSACSGDGPTSPSRIPTEPSTNVTAQPSQPPEAPPSSSLKLNPESATLVVGQSMTFTASGGDGWNYTMSAGPQGVLDWEQVSYNTVKVTLLDKVGFTAGWVDVIGYDGKGIVENKVSVYFR